MQHILLVEDDEHKRDELISFLNTSMASPCITLAPDVASGVAAIERQSYDLVIIDMALPSHPVVSGGGAPMSLLSGGLEILFELNSLQRCDPCIVVTQWSEVEIAGNYYPIAEATAAIYGHFECVVHGCIEYNEASGRWQTELARMIGEL